MSRNATRARSRRRTTAGYRRIGLLLFATLLLSGCAAMSRVGGRLLEDLFVVGTSPAQIPTMAVRDAIFNFAEPGISAILFPITFPLFLLQHSIYTAVHAVDLAVAPVHFLHESESLGLYEVYGFPMQPGPNTDVLSEGFGGTVIVALMIGIPVALAVFSASLGGGF